MQDTINTLLNLLPVNTDAIGLSVATGIATVLIVALKALFTLARKLTQKTSSAIDDKIVDEAEASFKDKAKDI